ncbi:MAG: tetratricopeptide repeat protein [Verrucomicrobiota bacterium]
MKIDCETVKHSPPSGTRLPTLALWALVFAVTLAAYWPALDAGFIWDDSGHVTRPELRSASGLARIWFEPGATQQYYPLLHSAFWLEHQLWGDRAAGYHLLNVLLHALGACLLGTVLRRLQMPGAWLAAALFAVHPVCVESVAWISEQKNTLFTVLYLGAALAYLRFDAECRRKAYVWATCLFVAAVLTKTVAATLPAALLVVFWWRRGQLTWRADVVPLLPWFAFGLLAGVMTAWVEHTWIGAQGADFALGWPERLLVAGRAPWFYLSKLLWPAPLIFTYPRWEIDAGVAWQYLFPAATLGALVLFWSWRHRQRGPLAAALFFGGSLFPALGFINVYPFIYSYVADHFQYLAMIGILALIAASLIRLPTTWRNGIAASALVALTVLTWRQCGTYRDAETLYKETLRQNPASWMAHNNLAILLVDTGRAAEAIPHYEQALQLRKDYVEAEKNIGFALVTVGRPAEALPHLERAVRLRPTYAEAQNNLGIALMALGRTAEGMAAFRSALQLKPGYAVAHVNLGLALARAGDTAQALACFERAARLDPAYADAELNWGVALRALGRTPEALPHLTRAVQLAPNLGPAHFHLALAFKQLGRETEAASHFQTASDLGFRPPMMR